MGNKESNDTGRPRSDISFDVPDETGTRQRHLTGGRSFSSHSDGVYYDDVPIPPPYIPDDLQSEHEGQSSPLSPESEADIPIFDDGRSTPFTEPLPVASGNSSSDIEQIDNNQSTPVQEFPVHSNQTTLPQEQHENNQTTPNIAVYIDTYGQVSPIPVPVPGDTAETHEDKQEVTRSKSVISSQSTSSELQSHVLSPLAYQVRLHSDK